MYRFGRDLTGRKASMKLPSLQNSSQLISRRRSGANILVLQQWRHQATVATTTPRTSPHNYVAQAYSAWKASPESVHESWREYFQHLEHGISLIRSVSEINPPPEYTTSGTSSQSQSPRSSETNNMAKLLKVQRLAQAYQSLGHLKAKTNPLGLEGTGIPFAASPELEIGYYGLTEADLDDKFVLNETILPHFSADNHDFMTLREIIAACERIYCSSYGVEYSHIPEQEKREWIRSRLEVPQPIQSCAEEKKDLLKDIAAAAAFEKFIATKYPVEKRYGLDGGETLVPGMRALVNRCAELGAKDFVIGSQHRGRLNVMSNVFGLPYELALQRFGGDMSLIAGQTGDVKYHLGIDNRLTTPSGKDFNVSFLPNPSHLEAEAPVAIGKSRAVQDSNAEDQDSTVCLNIHGDAAIAGQGVVYETLTLSQLRKFSVGGVIHVTVNNQVGFTTDPQDSRSTLYCTDVAKSINAPVFHVNGDDPEAVAFFFKLAAEWRAKFKSDCFLDLVCYRKHGHNEMDQPAFTQPSLYNTISQQRPILDIYGDKLLSEGVISQREFENLKTHAWDTLSAAFEASKTYEPPENVLYPHLYWSSIPSPTALAARPADSEPRTAITSETITTMASKISSLPDDSFVLHPNLDRILAARKKTLDDGTNIDWSTAEALAFGSLVLEGHPVRISGQDVERGTFSQRHAVLHNQQKLTVPTTAGDPTKDIPSTWTPLANLHPTQAPFVPANSPLSEFGVLGFEYGYSLGNPAALVMWEAQFGDFANNAQVLIDNFIASGEAKWLQRSGVVLSLPHGFDGQGPEHSSARLERFLQLGDEEPDKFLGRIEAGAEAEQRANLQIVCLTEPANFFHVLRRQVKRAYRKPLVIFFSKSLLRHPLAKSKAEDFTGDTAFRHVIPDAEHRHDIVEPDAIKRVVLCSGQVYAALHKYRRASGVRNVALTRVEQLHPFPWSQVKENLDQYPNAKSVVWCQEEPRNGGAWQHVQPRIDTVLSETKYHVDKHVEYVGRTPYAGVATGSKAVHVEEEQKLLKGALDAE